MKNLIYVVLSLNWSATDVCFSKKLEYHLVKKKICVQTFAVTIPNVFWKITENCTQKVWCKLSPSRNQA